MIPNWTTEITILIPIFLFGLVSSLHCLVMCGPFLGVLQTEKANKQTPLILYHLGRMSSYTFMGLFLGFLGKGANALGELAEYSGIASLVTLFFLLVILIKQILGNSVAKQSPQVWFLKPILHMSKRFSKNGLGFGIGFFSALLPCGVLYPAFAAAFATGSVFLGGLVMFVFYLGTVPTLAGFGFFLKRIRQFFKPQWIQILGIILVLLSMTMLTYRTFFHSHSNSCDHISSK